MKTLKLIQGSPEWEIHRATHLNASDAPVMLGLSSYRSRDDLLQEKKTGISPEIDAHAQRIFDKGHQYEAMARPVAEKMVDDDLFPIVGSLDVDGLPLSSSFDGITEDYLVLFEHKSINDNLRQVTCIEQLDEQYKVQMEQQLMVSGGSKCLFMASNGTEEDMVSVWYESDPVMRKRILDGWSQFQIDLNDFVPVQHAPEAVADVIKDLPSLIIDISGEVRSTNMSEYEESAKLFISNINTTLETDEDFANAEANVKFCQKSEKELELVKEQALAKTADISQLFKTVNNIGAELRAKRLALDKLVKSEKANKKNAIVQSGIDSFNDFVTLINKEFGYSYITGHPHNFVSVVKGKRTLASLHGAVNDELARLKIEVNDLAQTIRTNIKTLDDKAGEYKFLFSDKVIVIHKECEDFTLLVESRVQRHIEDEAEKARQRHLADEEEKARQHELQKSDNKADTSHVRPVEPVSQSAKNEVSQQKEIVTPDDELLRVYAQGIEHASNNIPNLADKKLTTFLRTIEKRVNKACGSVYEKSNENKAA